jgi:hypothetical protein
MGDSNYLEWQQSEAAAILCCYGIRKPVPCTCSMGLHAEHVNLTRFRVSGDWSGNAWAEQRLGPRLCLGDPISFSRE